MASLLGLLAALAVLGLGQLWARTLDPGGSLGWVVVLLLPTIGGLVAGVRTRSGVSAGVGSGLLVGLWLGVIAIHVGIGQATDVVAGDRAGAWILLGIVGTPFLMLVGGMGGVLGTGLAGVLAERQGTSTTGDATSDSGETGDPGGTGASDRSPSLVGTSRATLEGIGATFLLGVVGLFAGPLILGAPFLGGFVAGYRSPGGTGLGTFCGVAVGVVTAVATFALVLLELRSQTYVAPGVGYALVFLAGALFVGIVLASVGGFVGAIVATADESQEDTGAPAESTES